MNPEKWTTIFNIVGAIAGVLGKADPEIATIAGIIEEVGPALVSLFSHPAGPAIVKAVANAIPAAPSTPSTAPASGSTSAPKVADSGTTT